MIEINLTARYGAKPKRRARFSRTESGRWIGLAPLPAGLGAVFGSGMTGYFSVRSWEWARYDYADHHPEGSEFWAFLVRQDHPKASHPIAAAWDAYQTHSHQRRLQRRRIGAK